MLTKISQGGFVRQNRTIYDVRKTKNGNLGNATNTIQFKGANNVADTKATSPISSIPANQLAGAYMGYNGIKPVSNVSFTGAGSLSVVYKKLNERMRTCDDGNNGGETVGNRFDVTGLYDFKEDLPDYDDAVKTTVAAKEETIVDKSTGNKIKAITNVKYQIENAGDGNLKLIATKRPPITEGDKPHRTNPVSQLMSFIFTPLEIKADDENKRSMVGTPERAYVLNTKGNLMAVVEDSNDKDVLLTNAGEIHKKDPKDGKLDIVAKEYTILDENGQKLETMDLIKRTSSEACENDEDTKLIKKENKYKPFEAEMPEIREKSGGSQGGGTEIVIGLEQGRFVPEIIESIKTFVDKVNNGEIVLDKFVPAKGAQNIQLSMLAGGYGSRAEYTNASSSRIFHGKKDGSNLTKGCFRTATGLTPMETTFISLHKAGLLDCSKGNLEIGKNIKFYLNDSNVNGGNGGFTVDMYNTMEREDRKSLLIMPNDAMSRIPKALSEVTEKINSGKAAVVMVAKEVDKEDARGKLGIMKIDDEGKIAAFAEKPKEFEEGYVKDDKCFANTFQFAVSKEAFKALSILDEYLPANNSGKEPRDWSKTFTPILMGLTQNEDIEEAKKAIEKVTKNEVPSKVIKEAKDALKDQKIYAVTTNEPWADCGSLNALYHTTMQIAAGNFPLEDFERLNVLKCVNTQTGLVASSEEQKERIENKYDIKGQVMVVPKAEPVDQNIVNDYKDAITRYSDKKSAF